MNEEGSERFETELRRLKPAQPPAAVLARLAAAKPAPTQAPARPDRPESGVTPWRLFRWLVPATAVGLTVAVLILWRSAAPTSGPATAADGNRVRPMAARAADGAPDAFEFDRRLVASYDALAEMPGGEPVRLRCSQWEDRVVFRDPARGIAVETRTPRLEVVPVRLETY